MRFPVHCHAVRFAVGWVIVSKVSIKEKKPLRVGLISLGCAKNLVDAEIMLGTLIKEGLEITNDPAEADAVIVNTCSFIDSAQEESVDTILESVELRDANRRGQAVVVSGCLSQRFREELPKLLPEVDAFMGVDQVSQVGGIVAKAVANRARHGATGPTPSKGGKAGKNLSAQLAELEKQVPEKNHERHGAHESPSETGRPGKTRKVVAPASHAPVPMVDVTHRPSYIPDFATPRLRLTPRHFAYLKIAEGCNHPCSFCIIPRMRGSHRSRAQSDIVAEARALVSDGVREINLISQDSTYYGLDLRPKASRAISSPEKFAAASRTLSGNDASICTLLRELNAIPGDFWVRLLYTHPAHWTDELIQTMGECSKVAKYVDMPLQHIHEHMLERMRRETSRQYIEDLIGKIRAGIPGIALRTTFIVGFPGETEERFESLCEFIRTTRFERLGVFAYSKEEGTRAGGMEGQVPDKVKQRRREKAMAVQHAIACELSSRQVGSTLRVLVEGEASGKDFQTARVDSWEHGLVRGGENHPLVQGRQPLSVGRGEADAPDIDGRVYVRGRLNAGEFAAVRVVDHTDYDLIAEPV